MTTDVANEHTEVLEDRQSAHLDEQLLEYFHAQLDSLSVHNHSYPGKMLAGYIGCLVEKAL